MRGVLAVAMSEGAQHALDGHTGRVHCEWMAAEPPEVVSVTHALERGIAVVGGRCRHALRT
jgi:hypothetical protein